MCRLKEKFLQTQKEKVVGQDLITYSVFFIPVWKFCFCFGILTTLTIPDDFGSGHMKHFVGIESYNWLDHFLTHYVDQQVSLDNTWTYVVLSPKCFEKIITPLWPLPCGTVGYQEIKISRVVFWNLFQTGMKRAIQSKCCCTIWADKLICSHLSHWLIRAMTTNMEKTFFVTSILVY